MSSPIAIPSSKRSSSSSSSSSSASSSLSSAPTTPTSAGVYIPVHKRTGSSSSRAFEPSGARLPALSVTEVPKQHPRVYSADFLLSLRPNADESLKEQIRASCPEVVMNRRTKKNLEFAEHQHQRELSSPRRHAGWNFQQQPVLPTLSTPTPIRVPTAAPPTPARVTPRRNRPAGRAPERRRQALQSSLNLNDSWRDIRLSTSTPLPVV
ncbi:hypothetical protein GALMADRAFT_241948 [Galerina marginata CBS 339.88]|uniref:Uncharacterized protein n=1 Tax=Galerina marginata (strain CBS 339.88) TaxID=685588 RepID=A0A067TLL0_GALM3|nr:hypothetical protein GALMADRAFT_241948 [Galerina marginata CBS 339.88]